MSKFVKLYVGIKNGLNLKNPITNKSLDYYSPFFRHPVVQSNNYLYNKTRHSYLYMKLSIVKTQPNLYNKTRHSYIYMTPIAGQTAGPNGLKLLMDTQGWTGGVLG